MSTMILSRSLRRFVAGAVAVLFLACLGTMDAYARTVGASGFINGAPQGSCHDASPQPGDPSHKNTCQANCESQINSTTPSGATIVAAADLPALTVHFDPIKFVSRSISLAALPPPRVESPPLAILHCCLRN